MNFDQYLEVLPQFLIAFAMGLLLTPILRKIGLKYGFATKPKSQANEGERSVETRLHKETKSRLGEFAMLIPLGLLMWKNLELDTRLFGIVTSIFMIGVLGAFDSKYNLSEFVKLYILFTASIILIFTGTFVSLGQIINYEGISWLKSIVDFVSISNPLTNSTLDLFSILISLAWFYIISTAISYVGGTDGLSEGTAAIAILILTLIGIRNFDILTITIGTLCLGGLLGLLPYNFYPSVIMSEHLIYGFVIAILAITSEAKVATSLLIVTIPLIDFVYVTSRRLRKFFTESPQKNLRMALHYMGSGDKSHLHHKMLDLGLNHVQIALVQYLAYAILGVIALAVTGLYLTLAVLGSVSLTVLIFYYINKLLIRNVKFESK